MLKVHRLIFILALLLIPLFLSSCYTIVGYPPDVEETVKKDTEHKSIYREYYYDSPYYWDGLDDYPYYLYGWYPYFYDHYNWYHSGWSYNDRRYWDDNNHYYAPEKKPEIRKREATELRRSPREDRKSKEETVQPKVKQESSGDDQKSPRKYRDDSR